MAQYGDFSGYVAAGLMTQEQANNAAALWKAQNYELAYSTGSITADEYNRYNSLFNPVSYSSGSSGSSSGSSSSSKSNTYNDPYSLLYSQNITDAGTAYPYLLSLGYSSTEAKAIGEYYTETYLPQKQQETNKAAMGNVQLPNSSPQDELAEVSLTLAELSATGASKAQIAALLQEAVSRGVISENGTLYKKYYPY